MIARARSRDVVRSSAMSDTSEAPSLASHVRRVRVPSQASGTQNNSFFFPIYPMICRYTDEGVLGRYGAFPDRGPVAEDSATKLKRGRLKVCTVYGVLFSPCG
jgi:hypothetical protein